MCTAISFKTKNHYFGRNLDLEYSYDESVVITPRNFPLKYRCEKEDRKHLSIIGTALIKDNYPLYYDATNEKGLSMAGLRFPEAVYFKEVSESFFNISPFEFIPWVLSKCETVKQAEELIRKTNLVCINFSDELTLSPLHWIISDKNCSIVIESTRTGIKIYDNTVGVLTNSPAFPYHMTNLNNYMNLSPYAPKNTFSDNLALESYSLGMGAIGLPGDLSSASRFIRAAFVLSNSICDSDEVSSVNQFFHILSSVSQQRGCTRLENGKNEITLYSSCCNTDKGVYYYTTYDNSQISAVNMHRENLEGCSLISYRLLKRGAVMFHN